MNMKDKNGNDVAVGDTVWHRKLLCTVRRIEPDMCRKTRPTVAIVDDGIPGDPDLTTNRFTLASVASSREIEKTGRRHRFSGMAVVDIAELARLRAAAAELDRLVNTKNQETK